MTPTRRGFLALTAPALLLPLLPRAAWADDPRMADRAVGSDTAPVTVMEYFSLTCPHCAAFARDTFPQIQSQLIDTGKLRYVFRDYPLDQVALTAAQVARALPPERYEPFVMALLASQDRWAFAAASTPPTSWPRWRRWPACSRAAFDAAVADTGLRDAILAEQQRRRRQTYHVNSTPTFIFNGPKRMIGANRRAVVRHVRQASPRSAGATGQETPLPVSFVRLRIAGFKSFAEPTIVEILPGLTGIVGPNGCGKSNVVEALRWAMGENSARSLRGGEMDDVIFAGTAAPPVAQHRRGDADAGRDRAGMAPAAVPRASRSWRSSGGSSAASGSVYRINGREARARDVQTLFADLASGARSSAMVSQGRVGALVNAKPDERRAILEEAAGITGLHARRHEAELKLRAAEANLARAEDLRGAARDPARRPAAPGAAGDPVPQHFRRPCARPRRSCWRCSGRGSKPRARRRGGGAAPGGAWRRPPRRGGRRPRRGGHRGRRGAAGAAGSRGRGAHRAGARTAGAGADRRRGGAGARARWRRRGTALAQIGRDLGHAEQLQRDATAADARLAARTAGWRQDEAATRRAAAAAARGGRRRRRGARGRGGGQPRDRARGRGSVRAASALAAGAGRRPSSARAGGATRSSAGLRAERAAGRGTARRRRRGWPRPRRRSGRGRGTAAGGGRARRGRGGASRPRQAAQRRPRPRARLDRAPKRPAPSWRRRRRRWPRCWRSRTASAGRRWSMR